MLHLRLVACTLILLIGCDEPKKKVSDPHEPVASDQTDEDAEASGDQDTDESPADDEDEQDSGEEETGEAGMPPDAAEGTDVDAQPTPDAGSDAGQPPSNDAATSTSTSGDAGTAPMSTWGDQPCDKASTKPGCKDKALALCICRGPDAEGGNSFCCNERWSYLCVDGALAVDACKFVSNSCCEAHPGDGCETPKVEQCVCDEVQRMKRVEMEAGRNPASVHDCCHEGWSGFCAILATTTCAATCS